MVCEEIEHASRICGRGLVKLSLEPPEVGNEGSTNLALSRVYRSGLKILVDFLESSVRHTELPSCALRLR